MRSSRFLAAVVLAAAPATLAASAAAAAPVGFLGCRALVVRHPAPLVRPHSILLACADANAYLTGLRWSSWGSASAAGAGTLHENDCKPYCAAGHFHSYPARVVLSRPRRCKGTTVFTHIAWTARGRRLSLDYGC